MLESSTAERALSDAARMRSRLTADARGIAERVGEGLTAEAEYRRGREGENREKERIKDKKTSALGGLLS